MSWRITKVIRGFSVFDININTNFYVDEFIRKERYSFVYSYRKIVATSGEYDSTIELVSLGNHQYVLRTASGSNISNESIVSVLVYEVDYVEG